MESDENDSVFQTEELNVKYHKLLDQLVTLKEQVDGGGKRYDVIYKEYSQATKQNEDLTKLYNERGEEITELMEALKNVQWELDVVSKKYEIEIGCRATAETYASRITKENKTLRRVSSLYITQNGGVIPVDEGPDTYTEFNKTVNKKLEALEDEVSTLTATLQEKNTEILYTKEISDSNAAHYRSVSQDLVYARDSLHQYEVALEETRQSYQEKFDECELLREQYEREVACRGEAEKYASSMHHTTEAIKRESTVWLSSAFSNEKLANAFNEIEDLSEKLEKTEFQYKKEIKEFEMQITELRDNGEVTKMVDLLSKQEMETENLRTKLEEYVSQYKILETQYKELQNKYEDATRPPPPPPPPPLPAVNTSRFLQLFKGKDKTKKKTAAASESNPDYQKAINEMMDRIRNPRRYGALRPALKSVKQLSDATDTTTEAQRVMMRIKKRSNTESDLLGRLHADEISELGKTFRKITSKDGKINNDTTTVSSKSGKNDIGQSKDNSTGSVGVQKSGTNDSTCSQLGNDEADDSFSQLGCNQGNGEEQGDITNTSNSKKGPVPPPRGKATRLLSAVPEEGNSLLIKQDSTQEYATIADLKDCSKL